MESVFPTPIFHSLNELELKTEKSECMKQELNDEEGKKKNENENLANVLEEFLIPQKTYEKTDDMDDTHSAAEINKVSKSMPVPEYKENEHKFSFAEHDAIKIKGSQIQGFKVFTCIWYLFRRSIEFEYFNQRNQKQKRKPRNKPTKHAFI